MDCRREPLTPLTLRPVILLAVALSCVVIGLWGISPAAASPVSYHLPRLDGRGAAIGPIAARRGVAVPPPTHALSLAALTGIALRNNPQTRVAWAKVQADAAALGVARSAYWPQVSVSASVTRVQSLSNTGAAGPAQTRYGPALSLSYLLWDFGARAGQTRSAEYTAIGARLARSQTLQDVMLQVEQAYYLTQGLKALVQADEKTVSGAQASLDSARKRRELGLATVGDVYQARAAVAQARLTLQRDRGQLEQARGSLANAVGYAPDTPLRLLPWREHSAPVPAVTVKALLARARAARPALLASKAVELASLAHVRAVRAQGLPRLTFDGSVGKNWIAGGQGHASSSYSVGATLNIPLFAGFADRYALEQARAQASAARASTDVLLRQVELAVWQALHSVRTDAATLRTSDTLLSNAELAERVVRARYSRGLDTILNLLTAQATLAAARAQKVQDLVNYYSDLGVLGHAVGGLPAPGNGR